MVQQVRFRRPASQRKVNDANVVGLFEIDGTLNSGDYGTVRSGAIGVKHTQVDQIHPGRDALHIPVGNIAVARDNSSNMCTVPVLVAGVEAGDETLTVDNARVAGVKIHQVRMAGANAAIDDRYSNAVAGITSVDHAGSLRGIQHKS